MKQRIHNAHQSVSKGITYHFRLCFLLFFRIFGRGLSYFWLLGSLTDRIVASSIHQSWTDFLKLIFSFYHEIHDHIPCLKSETSRHRPWKYPEKGDSYWKPPFLGDMLVSGRDIIYNYHRNMFEAIQLAIFQVQRTLQNAFSPPPLLLVCHAWQGLGMKSS